MFGFFEQFALSLVLGILQRVIKNPKTYAQELNIVQHIYTDAGLALAALQGAPPPSVNPTPSPAPVPVSAATPAAAVSDGSAHKPIPPVV